MYICMYTYNSDYSCKHIYLIEELICVYKPLICGQHCFELVSSHQQGIHITCLAHHSSLYTQGEPEYVIVVHAYMYVNL